MSALAQFVLVAVALFLWESTLWLPLRGIALRRRWRSGRWNILDPGSLFATREVGLIPMLPFPPDAGLAPCQAPPLVVGPPALFFAQIGAGHLVALKPLAWDDLVESPHYLEAGGTKIRISSPRCIGLLRRAKKRGATPEAAVRQAWRLALSPARAGREWRRWKLVAGPLRWHGLVLTLGFFGGLPWTYVAHGSAVAVVFGLWLWCLMAWTAGHLWWLGKRVYPDARADLRMDAILALLVPFHAMRACEIAAVHAMGTTHPAGLILSTRDLHNPWLARFARRLLHPLPDVQESAGFSAVLLPLLANALSRCGARLQDFDIPPDRSDDPQAAGYCPRCHSLYLAGVDACPDCHGLELKRFGVADQ